MGWIQRGLRRRRVGCLAALVAGAAVAGGCASTSVPEPTYYLMTTTSAGSNQQLAAEHVVRLAPIELAAYLRGDGIVVQTGESTVEQARQHRWAEDLASQIQRDLRRGLASQLPGVRVVPPRGTLPEAGAPTLSVTVARFQGRFDGYAVVAGDWRLCDSEGVTRASGAFYQEDALGSDGYRALVASLKAAWAEALGNIASSLRAQGWRGGAGDSD